MKAAGSVALVTGGASGLGLATAEALRDAGATVVVADLAAPDPAAGLHHVPADVRSDEDIARAVEVATGLGELRIATCCAGVGTPGRILRKGVPLELGEFRRIVEVNLIGTFNAMRLAAAAMAANEPLEGERGVLVGTASAAAFEGQVGQCSYAASKGGVVGMTLPIARDLADSLIRCVALAPGLFDTPLLGAIPDSARQALERTIPNPSRLGRPAEFAALVMHVVENQMINGETLRIDGALRMAPR